MFTLLIDPIVIVVDLGVDLVPANFVACDIIAVGSRFICYRVPCGGILGVV